MLFLTFDYFLCQPALVSLPAITRRMILFLKVGYAFDIIYIKLDAHVCQKAALKETRDHYSRSGSMNGKFASSPRGLFFDYTASLQCPMFSRVVTHRLYIYIV